MRRRAFIAGLGGAAIAWPLAARAQQRPLPIIGYLAYGNPESRGSTLTGLQRGLSEAGYVEGRNLTAEYRWAGDRYDRLPALADDLVRSRIAVIIALTTPAALAAKAATKSIPIVFSVGTDPVKAGLVPSLNRPGGNLTGIYNFANEVAAKRLELLHTLVPAAKTFAVLVNPTDPIDTASETMELQVAARTLGLRLVILNASDEREFEPAFATLVREGAGGLVVGSNFLASHADQLAALAARHAVPAIYQARLSTAAGGLMSYGTDYLDAYHQVGAYTGRILKGEKPADLPVQQVTKIELVLNMNAAKALGLTFPLPLLGRADEVIE